MNARYSTAFNRSSTVPRALLLWSLVALGEAAVPVSASSAELTRGPYLQSGTRTNIIVRWRTDTLEPSVVGFGTQLGNLNSSAIDLVPKREHIVRLDGLTAGTKYYYSVGTDVQTLAAGADHYFITIPAQPKPTRIWALGDCGTGSQAGQTGWRLVRDAYYNFEPNRETDVWLMLGDNAYYWGTDNEYRDAVFNVYQRMLTRNVLWSTIGNHETYAPQIGEPVAYFDIFSFPTAGEAGGVPSGTENYYSFDYGNIHFVCLDSELASRAEGSPMMTWLEENLAANTKDWLIAFWHSPPYTKGSHDSDNEPNLTDIRERFNPLLESYGVDLVLCGHSHSYERSFLIDGHYGHSDTFTASMAKDIGSGRENEGGPYIKPGKGPNAHEGAVYVVAGSSGWATSLQWGDPHEAMYKTLLEMGSMVIDVNGDRLDARFLRENGEIDDSFTIIKGQTLDSVRIASFRIVDSIITAQWKSKPGRFYNLQWTPSLTEPDWEDLTLDPVFATGATTSWTGAAPVTGNEHYYRVVELP